MNTFTCTRNLTPTQAKYFNKYIKRSRLLPVLPCRCYNQLYKPTNSKQTSTKPNFL